MYPKLAGMTGTAMTEAEEFGEIYALDVVQVPPNVPQARIDADEALSFFVDRVFEIERVALLRQR